MNILEKLNKEQYEATTFMDGPCLVIAGAVTIIPKHFHSITGEPIISGDQIKPGITLQEEDNVIAEESHTENVVTNNEAGEATYITADNTIAIQVKIEIINAWGFIGTIETGAEADTCTFKEGEQISVVCEDNVSIVQKDGSIFAFNEMDPNVDESDLEVGDFVWVGFRTYDYLEGNGMYNQVFPYHVSINPLQ